MLIEQWVYKNDWWLILLEFNHEDTGYAYYFNEENSMQKLMNNSEKLMNKVACVT